MEPKKHYQRLNLQDRGTVVGEKLPVLITDATSLALSLLDAASSPPS